MKHKKYKLRFIKNIAICVFALFIVARILDIMPGFKRDKTEGVTNLVIGDEDVTEDLNSEIYVDENEIVYISYEDVKELFDDTITFDEDYNQIITTSRTKVATMELNERYIIINDTLKDTLGTLIKKDGKIYIPISEMELVYNIEVNYTSDTDIVTIDKLDKKLTRATVAKNSSVKSKMRAFSQTLGTTTQGEQVSYYTDEYNGWTKIRTNSGVVGYIKTSNLTNEYVIRQDMEETEKAEIISQHETSGWLNIKDKSFEESMLEEYKSRAQAINSIVNFALSESAKGVIITSDLENINFINFMREMTPRLREIGVSVAIQTDNKDKLNKLKNIVDYIVE